MDDADRAQPDIERALALALAAHQAAAHSAGPLPVPRVGPDGRRVCLTMGCGEPLSAQRLAAVPSALYCVDCQAERERRT